MNTLEIPVKKIMIEYPGEWDELNREQAVYAGDLLYKVAKQKLDIDQFRKLMVDKLIRRVNNYAPRLTPDDELDVWGNESLLAETVNFFFKVTKEGDKPVEKYRKGVVVPKQKTEEGQEVALPDDHFSDDRFAMTDKKEGTENSDMPGKESWEIMPTFTKNLIPWARTGRLGKKLYGPGDFMQGMSFTEYKDLLASAMRFMETNEDAWLDRLATIFYRKKKPGLKRLMKRQDFDGKIRVPYNAERVEFDIKKTKRIKAGIKYMALMYMMGCLWTLKNTKEGNEIEIDGNKCDLSVLFTQGKNEDNERDGVGMIGVMMAIAESGVFGNLKDVANADVWDVLIRMYQLEMDRREFEKKTKSKSRD